MQPSPKLDALLPRWIQRAGELDPNMRNLAVDGHCDAFALALLEQLSKSLPQTTSSVVVISRQRVAVDDHTHILDENPFSHALVAVEGMLVDVEGIDADERWEDTWIQPDNDDEVVPSEDVFNYHPMTAVELTALRQSRDQRDPDKRMIKRFSTVLSQALNEVLAQPTATPRAKMR